MRKTVILGGLALLVIVHAVVSAPVEPFAEKNGFRQLELDPFARETFTVRCKAKERTNVIVYGKGRSPLGIYVFDVHGNCVAHDDESGGPISDDLTLEWFPPAEGMFEIDIRNLGRKQNVAEVAIR